MLAANAQLDIRACRPAPLGGQLDKLPHSVNIQADERIAREDALLHIRREETCAIITAHAQGGLREIIGAEAEECTFLGNFLRHQSRPWQLNHRPHEIFNCGSGFRENLSRYFVDQRFEQFQLAPCRDQRDHHFRDRSLARSLGNFASSLEDRTRLHLVNLGEGNSQTAPAMSQHRVKLVQFAGTAFEVVNT